MPAFTPEQGQFLIALFTIMWGIFIETWYVSRWTITFNVVPVLVMMTTLDLSEGMLQFLWVYAIGSIGIGVVTGEPEIKQIVGAKGFGALSLASGMINVDKVSFGDVVGLWLVLCIPIYIGWWFVRRTKMNRGGYDRY